MYSATGKVLRVNLTDQTTRIETFDDQFRRLYLGGWGFIAYYLLKEIPPGIDPLGAQNKLIFANGTVTGAAVGGSGRSSVGAKSPLIGGFGEADVGGYWGAEFARSGYDVLVIEGRSPEPIYLWIHDGQVEFRPAAHLWGKLTAETQEVIRNELNEPKARVAQIGPAGERLALIAAIMHDVNRAAARTGLGAVMGSKNLKAVVVRGSESFTVYDPRKVNELARWYARHYPDTWAQSLREVGTAGAVEYHQLVGGLPTRNFQQGTFEGWESIDGTTMMQTILKQRDTCFACPVHCKRVVAYEDERFKVEEVFGGPEYETVGSFGSMCAVSDLAAIAYTNQLCNAYGLDTISTGVTIAWAMDCYERGLITKDDTGGIELRFGNADALVQMVELMGKREGFGAILSLGSRAAARQIGRGTEELAVQVKGLEVPMHEPRVKYGLSVGYALSPTGADHNHNFHDSDYTTEEAIRPLQPFGITKPLPATQLDEEKMRLAAVEIPWSVVNNMMGFCGFIYFTFERPKLAELMSAITGWDITLHELLQAGERAYTMARMFNLRQGLSHLDDTLPRVFTQPFESGPSKGNFIDPQAFERAKIALYDLLGWDEQGIPRQEKLEALGIGWTAKELSK